MEKLNWIDASQTLPEKDYTEVILLFDTGEIMRATYCDDVDFNFTSPYFKAHHKHEKIAGWMNIPENEAQLLGIPQNVK